MLKIAVLGAGLSGCEVVYQLSKNENIKIDLFEQKNIKNFHHDVYKDLNFAELVCSNSFRSSRLHTAPGLLKKELEYMDSLIIKTALKFQVKAGGALAVSRKDFSKSITEKIKELKNVKIINEKVENVESIEKEYNIIVIATGPLTEGGVLRFLEKTLSDKNLYFYDAIAPLVDKDSIDMNICFKASRYDDDTKDYINSPMTKEEYYDFVKELKNGKKVPINKGDKDIFFEACMPVEVMASRGDDTLLYGPMRGDGLKIPESGKYPYAAIQFRQDDLIDTIYNMVGFQTRLTYTEQDRIFRKIPGLKDVKFFRYGSMHRNTFINAPKSLNHDMSLKNNPKLYLAGQISGVEGYIESVVQGLYLARMIVKKFIKKDLIDLPEYTATKSLINYILKSDYKDFQPMKMNFGLIPKLTKEDKEIYQKGKGKYQSKLAQSAKSIKFFVDRFSN